MIIFSSKLIKTVNGDSSLTTTVAYLQTKKSSIILDCYDALIRRNLHGANLICLVQTGRPYSIENCLSFISK